MSKSEIAELKRQVSLRDVVSGVVHLEQRGGEYWGLCPFHSEKTASFAIKNEGGSEVFFCQGCSKGGDVITFLELYDNISTKEAFERLRALAGNTEWREKAKAVQAAFQSVAKVERKTMPLSGWEEKEKALWGNEDAIKWLKDERGISLETVKALRLGYVPTTKGHLREEDEHARDKGWVMFPRIVGDKIVAVKLRSVVTKAFVQIAHMDPTALFNVETINAMEPVFVVEGEIDAATMEQADFRTVSIPNANTKLTPVWKSALKQSPITILAGDNDGAAGSEKMRQLHRELGDNTYLLLWPGAKDANDFFRQQCNKDIDVFRQRVLALVDAAKSTPVEGFTSLIQRLRNSAGTDGQNDPYRLHFSLPEMDKMAYVPIDAGYVVIYSTYSGTGKSVLVTQEIIEEARRGETVVVYSPELSGAPYLALVVAQTLPDKEINRSGVVTQAAYREAADALDRLCQNGNPFQFYVGHALPEGDPLVFIEDVLKVIRPTRFVIDTFPCIVYKHKGEGTVDAESRTASSIEALGKKYGCIFIIVGQSNKEAEDLKEKRRDSQGVLRGSRVLYDKAHAIFLIHRKKLEDATGKPDLLEDKTLFKMEKNRTSGPGASAIILQYVRKRSRFCLREIGDSGNIPTDQVQNHEETDDVSMM